MIVLLLDERARDDEDLPKPLKTLTPEGLGSHVVFSYVEPDILDEDSGKEE